LGINRFFALVPLSGMLKHLEKLLTKNLIVSILAGLSIVGGAFWTRMNDSKKQVVINPSNPKTAGEKNVANRNQFQELFDKKDEATINVADLPNVNGLAVSDLTEDRSTGANILTEKDLNTIKFLQTPSGSTLGYDDISDINILYAEGADKYSTKDIKSQTTTNRAALLTYSLGLAKSLNGYPFYTKLSPTEITFNLYSNNDLKNTGLAELEAIGLGYEAAVKRLLTSSVPDGLLDLHIKLTNNINKASQLIKNMKSVKTDKLLALNSARQYVEEADSIIGTLSEISYYLKDKNINLGQDDRLKLSLDIIR
jgi:hypothetical protein